MSDAVEMILRQLEAAPNDLAVGMALADALEGDASDEVFAYGVRWLLDKGIWLEPTSDGYAVNAHHLATSIARMPFSGPVTGPDVATTLRVFAAHLWGFRVWVTEKLLAGGPLPCHPAPTPSPIIAPARPAQRPSWWPGDVPLPYEDTEYDNDWARRMNRRWRRAMEPRLGREVWTTNMHGDRVWYYDNDSWEVIHEPSK